MSALRTIPQAFFTITSYDWITNVLVSRVGPVLKLDTPGVVHRISSRGAWAGKDETAQLEEYIDSIEGYIPHCDACTSELFKVKLTEVRAQLERTTPQPEPAQPSPGTRVKSKIRRVLGR